MYNSFCNYCSQKRKRDSAPFNLVANTNIYPALSESLERGKESEHKPWVLQEKEITSLCWKQQQAHALVHRHAPRQPGQGHTTLTLLLPHKVHQSPFFYNSLLVIKAVVENCCFVLLGTSPSILLI